MRWVGVGDHAAASALAVEGLGDRTRQCLLVGAPVDVGEGELVADLERQLVEQHPDRAECRTADVDGLVAETTDRLAVDATVGRLELSAELDRGIRRPGDRVVADDRWIDGLDEPRAAESRGLLAADHGQPSCSGNLGLGQYGAGVDELAGSACEPALAISAVILPSATRWRNREVAQVAEVTGVSAVATPRADQQRNGEQPPEAVHGHES